MRINQKIVSIIIFLILLIVLSCGIYFSIDKSSTTKPINAKDELKNNEEDNNLYIINEEISKILAYLNNEGSLEDLNNISCIMLSSDIGFDLNSNQDFFITYAAPIMECVYKYTYTHINLTPTTEQIIISQAEEKTLNEYFNQNLDLKTLGEVFENTENNETSKYFNQEYKILAEYYSGPGISNITYKVSRILKVNDNYEVTIIATQNKIEYIGIVKINIVDNHCQFDKLIFKKATN